MLTSLPTSTDRISYSQIAIHLLPILLNVYSEYLTKESLDVGGNFKIGGQIIHTLKYPDELVLLGKEEKLLQDMIDKIIEIGRCYGMEMNVGEAKIMIISRQPFPVNIMITKNN
jgi:hypothetical protein